MQTTYYAPPGSKQGFKRLAALLASKPLEMSPVWKQLILPTYHFKAVSAEIHRDRLVHSPRPRALPRGAESQGETLLLKTLVAYKVNCHDGLPQRSLYPCRGSIPLPTAAQGIMAGRTWELQGQEQRGGRGRMSKEIPTLRCQTNHCFSFVQYLAVPGRAGHFVKARVSLWGMA